MAGRVRLDVFIQAIGSLAHVYLSEVVLNELRRERLAAGACSLHARGRGRCVLVPACHAEQPIGQVVCWAKRDLRE